MKTLKHRRGLALGVMMSDLVLTWGLHRPRAVRAKSRSRGPSRTPPTPTRLPCELTLTAPENSHNALLFA